MTRTVACLLLIALSAVALFLLGAAITLMTGQHPILAGLRQLGFGLAAAITAEGSLSFLGLGVEPPTASWGSMLNEGRQFLLVAPHLTTYPGLAIMLTVLSLNLLGDALQNRLQSANR